MDRMTIDDQMRLIAFHMKSIDLLRCMLAVCFRVDAALLIEAAAKQDSIEAIREIVIQCGIPVPCDTRDEYGHDLIQRLIR